jgi:uncharacterized protein (TIGR03437 family)
MPAVAWRAAMLAFCFVAKAAEPARHLPEYTAASIVNAATNQPGPLAPLALVSLYGAGLATATRAISPDDIRNGALPTVLGGASIAIDNIAIPILFVSPNQINFLVPGNLRPGRRRLVLQRSGLLGPPVEVLIAEASPGFFRFDQTSIIAVHADGSLLTPAAPAVPGEVLVLYAAGLGLTNPPIPGVNIPYAPAPIAARDRFAVLLNNEPAPDGSILYAGVTPGFAGLYQVNWRVPPGLPPAPEIRLRVGDLLSPPGLLLPYNSR